MRINKFISLSGVCSRRSADQLISQNKVTINGRHATLGQQVDPGVDQIYVNSRKVSLSLEKQYIIVNKPSRVLSTAKDEHGRPTVVDLVKTKYRLYPIGRLDFLSTGLILLTNDGDLTLRLTHPRFHLPKTYIVTIDRPILPHHLDQLQQGIKLEEDKTIPTKISIINSSGTHLRFILYQGLNRQIRRMLEHFDYRVLSLHRTNIGPLSLGNLDPGQFRPLTQKEIEKLTST